MNLKISLDENFNICYLSLTKNRCYNSHLLDENTRIIIIKGKGNALAIQEPNKCLDRYWFEDFDYLIFLEQTSQSEYKVELDDENCVDTILHYLDWRKVNYEVRNS